MSCEEGTSPVESSSPSCTRAAPVASTAWSSALGAAKSAVRQSPVVASASTMVCSSRRTSISVCASAMFSSAESRVETISARIPQAARTSYGTLWGE